MRPVSSKRHRFPVEVIRHAVWLYFRFTLSFSDVEKLLAHRRIATHAVIYNIFNLQRHLIRRPTLRQFRAEAHRTWEAVTAAA